MTRTGAGVTSVLADALADIANASLELDPAARARLGALDGRRLEIDAELPGPLGRRALTLEVTAGRLRFYPHGADEPHAVLQGAAGDIALWLLGRGDAGGQRLHMGGDRTLIEELGEIVRGFRPDLTAPLERTLGPEFSSRALGALDLAAATVRSAAEAVEDSIRAGSARRFVDRSGAADLAEDLRELRRRVDRLAVRVAAEERRRADS
ncbi:MAG: hypothetical protein ACODAC_03145 [Pseudomonadota bacterium]